MKITVNTKNLYDALKLGVINSNVSKFFPNSLYAQLSLENGKLRINIEAENVLTELVIPGICDSDEPASEFIESVPFKNIVSTITSDTVDIDFVNGGIVVKSGKSKYTLNNSSGGVGIVYNRPISDFHDLESYPISVDDWKFIRDNQLFAISDSKTSHPVYRYVWVSENDDVLAGDFERDFFIRSQYPTLGSTCLLSDTIINLFASLPDGCNLYHVGNEYVIRYLSDAFSYYTQFTPASESNPSIGSYNSEFIIEMLYPSDNYSTISCEEVYKCLKQASLLFDGNSSRWIIKFEKGEGSVHISDDHVDVEIECTGTNVDNYTTYFFYENFERLMRNYKSGTFNISPIIQEDSVVGVIVWNDDTISVLSTLNVIS